MEFAPPGNNFTTPKEIVENNLKEYLVTIEEASKHNVEILVFPEATLNYNGISSRAGILEFAVELVDKIGRESGCDYGNNKVFLSSKFLNFETHPLLILPDPGHIVNQN